MGRRLAHSVAVQYFWMALDSLTVAGEPTTRENLINYVLSQSAAVKKLNLSRESVKVELDKALQDEALVVSSGSRKGQITFAMPNLDMMCSDRSHDWYCFECHLSGETIGCTRCHRVYHRVCLPSSASSNSLVCEICLGLVKADRETAEQTLTIWRGREAVRNLLELALSRVNTKMAWKTLNVVGYLEESPRNRYLFHTSLDTRMISKKVADCHYTSFHHLMADIDLLIHNIQVMYSTKDEMFSMARSLRRELELEWSEMRLCPYCYTFSRQSSCMTRPCPSRHRVIWVQRTGFTFWPSKVLADTEEGLEVKAFGGKHERSCVAANRACLGDFKPVDLGIRMTPALKKAVAEMEEYKRNLAAYTTANEQAESGTITSGINETMSCSSSSSSEDEEDESRIPIKKLSSPVTRKSPNASPITNVDRKLSNGRGRSMSRRASLSSTNSSSCSSASSSALSSPAHSPSPIMSTDTKKRGTKRKSIPHHVPGLNDVKRSRGSIRGHANKNDESSGFSSATSTPAKLSSGVGTIRGAKPRHAVPVSPVSHSASTPPAKSNVITPPSLMVYKKTDVKIESPTITSSSFSPSLEPKTQLTSTSYGTVLRIKRTPGSLAVTPCKSSSDSSSSSSSDDEDTNVRSRRRQETTGGDSSDIGFTDLLPPALTPPSGYHQHDYQPPSWNAVGPGGGSNDIESSSLSDAFSPFATGTAVPSCTILGNRATGGGIKLQIGVAASPVSSAQSSSGVGSSTKSTGTSPGDMGACTSTTTPSQSTSSLSWAQREAEIVRRVEARLRSEMEERVAQEVTLRKKEVAEEKALWIQKIADLKKEHEEEVLQIKRRPWCVSCLALAKYYCCSSNTVNNSYCSQACLEEHWHKGHQNTCRRRR